MATDAFFKGCHDKRATLIDMYKDPENLVRAVQFVKSVMTNQRVTLGIKKTDVKRVTPQETGDCDPDDAHQASAC